MRNVILNTWVIMILIFLALSISIYYSFVCNNFTWFSRSGSLVTILGLLLTLKHHILSSYRDIPSIMKEKFHYAVFAPDERSELYERDKNRAIKIMRDEYIGVSFTVIGTVIWGYGDLVSKILI